MFSRSSLVVLATSVALVAAKTPSGFTPASNTDLIVTYGKTSPLNGVVIAQTSVATQPTIATATQLNGTSYAVIMIDLDIPFNVNPHTLLHWMQTDLTPAKTATSLSTTNGTSKVFLLENTKNTTALAAYISPGPPAMAPLSHRYVQILVDTSSVTTANLAVLKNSSSSRMGFDAPTVLKAANLANKVVAGNSYNVTNPGPIQAGTSSNSTKTTASPIASKTTASKTGATNTGASKTTASKTGAAATTPTSTKSTTIPTAAAMAVAPAFGTGLVGLIAAALFL